MKRIIIRSVLGLVMTAGLLSCEKEKEKTCSTYGYGSKITVLHAEMCKNDVAVNGNEVVNSADLRLKLFCEISTIKGATYERTGGNYECLHRDNMGLDPCLRDISVTCGQKIANIAPGADLLGVILPRVILKDQYNWSVDEWKKVLNSGHIDEYRNITLSPGLVYEFEIAFLPYFVTVAEGAYTFTLTMDFGWEWQDTAYTYSRNFSVALK